LTNVSKYSTIYIFCPIAFNQGSIDLFKTVLGFKRRW